MQEDPLYLTLTNMLLLAAIITVLLALMSSLLMAWFHAQTRLTSFALLRGLGSLPGQIARVIIWEQGVTYGTALALGVVFGALLAITIVPALIFTNPPYLEATSSAEFYALQHLLPAQLVFPGSLGLALVGLIVIYAAGSALMAYLVARPSISQTLRLSED